MKWLPLTSMPFLTSKGIVKKNFSTDKDAFDYSDVPALAERLQLFLTFETLDSKSRDFPSGAMHISKPTLVLCKLLLLKNIVCYVWEHETITSVDDALACALKYRPDRIQGMYYNVNNHVTYLISKFKLQTVTKVAGAYGAPKVQLLLNNIFARLPTGEWAPSLLQRVALIQTCSMTGMRISSLMATDKLNGERLGMRQEDVAFTTNEPGAWTMVLTICHLKGFNSAQDLVQVQVRMKPLKLQANILLEPMVVFILLLITCKALHANGPGGPLIKSVDQLLSSDLVRFIGVGEQPMFQHGDNLGKLNVQAACNQLCAHTSAVGLPYRSFHQLRQDFASQMQILFGSVIVCKLMHHNYKLDALNCNYTGGVELFNLVSI